MKLEPQFYGITKQDIQEIFEKTLQDFKHARIIYVDASYLYNFHLDDFDIIKKFNILGRYDINAVKQWHIYLERWLQDQTVIIGDKSIKPIKICRSFDKVVNEGLEVQAKTIIGEDTHSSGFPYRSIGDGELTAISPNNKTLVNEIDRIHVNETPEGGSLSRDGTTIYSIGNHVKSIPTADITECGMQNTENDSTDLMFDHSLFTEPIEHEQNVDAVGSTTLIYMCSS